MGRGVRPRRRSGEGGESPQGREAPPRNVLPVPHVGCLASLRPADTTVGEPSARSVPRSTRERPRSRGTRSNGSATTRLTAVELRQDRVGCCLQRDKQKKQPQTPPPHPR